jgi:hypothetical protein
MSALLEQGRTLPETLFQSQRPPAKRVAWIFGNRPEEQKNDSAINTMAAKHSVLNNLQPMVNAEHSIRHYVRKR